MILVKSIGAAPLDSKSTVNTELKSYNFKNEPIGQALAIIAKDLHKKLVVVCTVSGTVTMKLSSVRPIVALQDALLQCPPTMGLTWDKNDLVLANQGGYTDHNGAILPLVIKHGDLDEVVRRVQQAYPVRRLLTLKTDRKNHMIIAYGSRRMLQDVKAFVHDLGAH